MVKVAVVIKRVGAEMLALGFKGRSRAEAVSQKAFYGIREIVPAKDRKHVLRNIGSQVRHNDGDAVDYRIFAEALSV
jgi:hypothetical protein